MTTSTETAAGKMPPGANAPYKIFPAGKKFVVKNNAGEVKATFDTKAKALDYLQALYANVKGAQKRAAKVPFSGKAKNRAPKEKACLPCDRRFVTDEAFLTHVETVHPHEAARLEAPTVVGCYEPDCARAFQDVERMVEHAARVHSHEKTVERAEAVLTFDDTRRLVHEYIREQFGREGDFRANPVIPSIWTWIEDMASDWVVYTIEQGNESTLYKASYSITDGAVTLGDPTEVQRRTVYEPVSKEAS